MQNHSEIAEFLWKIADLSGVSPNVKDILYNFSGGEKKWVELHLRPDFFLHCQLSSPNTESTRSTNE